MKKLIRYLLLVVGTTASHCTFADGGTGAGGGFGSLIVITAIGWICSSVYIGIVLKNVTGKKKYIFASPFIPWLSILVMIVVAGLFGVLIDNLLRINSSTAESIGLFISLAFQMMICALVIWKVKQKLIKQLTSRVAVPIVLASYLWVEAFVI